MSSHASIIADGYEQGRRERMQLIRSEGSTMVEMIVIVGIIGVIGGAALPHFDSRRENVNTVMHQLIGEFRTARTSALTIRNHYAPRAEPRCARRPAPDTGRGRHMDDAGFNNAANLPPLTPRFVYVQQVLFTENFR